MSGCGFTSSTCMDDLRRWSTVGLCGAEDSPESEAAERDEWDDDDLDPIGPDYATRIRPPSNNFGSSDGAD